MRKNQQGASYIGILVGIIAAAFLLKIIVAVWPLYWDDNAINKQIAELVSNSPNDITPTQFSSKMGQKFDMNNIRDVKFEDIATVSTKSVGPGTRKNIDEFTRTTAGAIEKVGGAKQGKAIIIINPAEPPLMMRDTVHCLVDGEPDQVAITESVNAMIKEVQKYVPGYKLVNGPVFDGNRVSIFLEVEGLGDYLPKYAGNLDIMTAAAARTAEMFAERVLSNPKAEVV